MATKTFVVLLFLTPFTSTAPTEERPSLPSDGFIELYNGTAAEDTSPPLQQVSKASMAPQPPPQPVTIPVIPPNIPLVLPRPFSIPFPFPFPPPAPQFPNLVIAVPRPQKNLQTDLEEEDQELSSPADEPADPELEGRRAPLAERRKKKPKKPKKQKKQKKQKNKKKQKRPKNPTYPQPIIIYQNQDEAMGAEGGQQPAAGVQGAQSSYLGYYMVYVVEVRWTGNNYTQTVVTGRPVPAAITLPTSTEPGLVNSLSETIVPANLVSSSRPPTTPTCLFQRSTTTEHFGGHPEVATPLESTDVPGVEEATGGGNQEQIGEETEDGEDADSVDDEDYEDDESDPKKRKKGKKHKKELLMVTPSPGGANQGH